MPVNGSKAFTVRVVVLGSAEMETVTGVEVLDANVVSPP